MSTNRAAALTICLHHVHHSRANVSPSRVRSAASPSLIASTAIAGRPAASATSSERSANSAFVGSAAAAILSVTPRHLRS